MEQVGKTTIMINEIEECLCEINGSNKTDQGKYLHGQELITSVEKKLDDILVRQLRKVYAIRNKIIHENFQLEEFRKYEKECDSILVRLKGYLDENNVEKTTTSPNLQYIRDESMGEEYEEFSIKDPGKKYSAVELLLVDCDHRNVDYGLPELRSMVYDFIEKIEVYKATPSCNEKKMIFINDELDVVYQLYDKLISLSVRSGTFPLIFLGYWPSHIVTYNDFDSWALIEELADHTNKAIFEYDRVITPNSFLLAMKDFVFEVQCEIYDSWMLYVRHLNEGKYSLRGITSLEYRVKEKRGKVKSIICDLQSSKVGSFFSKIQKSLNEN